MVIKTIWTAFQILAKSLKVILRACMDRKLLAQVQTKSYHFLTEIRKDANLYVVLSQIYVLRWLVSMERVGAKSALAAKGGRAQICDQVAYNLLGVGNLSMMKRKGWARVTTFQCRTLTSSGDFLVSPLKATMTWTLGICCNAVTYVISQLFSQDSEQWWWYTREQKRNSV